MKRYCFLILLATMIGTPAFAIDHDNVDGGRPLRFDDAESIGLRERALEWGIAPTWARGSRFRLGLSAEYLYGFALNTYYSVDMDASNRGFGRTGLGLFHNFRRETLAQPALALRLDAYLPTGNDIASNRGTDFRVRGILSRTIRSNERVHLNLDGVFRTDTAPGYRAFVPAITVGYTRPIGYPKRFDRTMLAEVSYRADDQSGKGGILSLGAGMRQQVTPRSVMDLGIQSDVIAAKEASRDTVRLVAGLSTSF